jgi:Pre ATP-grasp domain/PGM1 C-terminal domain
MPRIILANVRADYSESVRMTSGFLQGTKSGGDTCARFLWHADEGDVVIIPDVIDPEFVDYVGGTAGFDPASVKVLTVNKLLSDATLLDGEFVGELRCWMSDPSEWSLFPFVLTRGVVEFGSRLGLGPLPGSEFALQSGTDLLNMKSTFRRLAAGVGTPIAAGAVARSEGELAQAIRALADQTGMVIVKQDRGGGGHGNIGLATSSSASLPGTRVTRSLRGDLAELAGEVWAELTDTQNSLVVVETYHPAQHRFYLEYHVGDDAVSFLNGGMARYSNSADTADGSPEWVGLDLPLKLGTWSYTEVISRAREFLEVVAVIGYRGYVNIDGLITPEGDLVFHEINARWGGSLVYHSIAARLLGRSYADSHVVSSVLNIKPGPFSELLHAVRSAGLAYSSDTCEGVLILASDSDLGGGAECLIVGTSEERVRALEADLRSCTEGA